MQYTIRHIPPAVDAALRRRAKQEHKSLNEVTTDALRRGSGAGGEPLRHRNLRNLAGTWREDRDFDAAIRDQHRIDEHLWK